MLSLRSQAQFWLARHKYRIKLLSGLQHMGNKHTPSGSGRLLLGHFLGDGLAESGNWRPISIAAVREIR